MATSTYTGDGNPDLRLHGILRGAIKALDVEVLLDPLEKQFHLPAAAIQLRDSQWRQREVVGQEHEGFVGFGVVILYTADFVGIILGLINPCEHHRRIADPSSGAIDRMGIHPAALHV